MYRELQKLRAVRARKAVLSNVLDYLGLALALEGSDGAERNLLFDIARRRTLGRYSDALEFSRTDELERTFEAVRRNAGASESG